MNRTTRHDRHGSSLVLGVAAALVFALVAGASAESDRGWQIRFYAAAIDMNDDPTGPNRAGGSSFDLDVGGGLGFNAEYRFSPRLGLDLGILSGAGVDVETGATRAGNWGFVNHESVTFTPLTAGLDIHLIPDARVDVYVCPLVALVQYGGLAVRSGPTGVRTEWDFDEEFAFGAGLGIGVPFGRNERRQRWSFQANLTYLESSLNGSNGDASRITSDYDSTIFGLGFGYRFGRHAG